MEFMDKLIIKQICKNLDISEDEFFDQVQDCVDPSSGSLDLVKLQIKFPNLFIVQR